MQSAKVIENSQRDINIAFVNELAKIFNLMNINTQDVLAMAAQSGIFFSFKPGLVGGHSEDPYYLFQKAQDFGYNPEIILAGRRMTIVWKLRCNRGGKTNDKNIRIKNFNIHFRFIFKENCPDLEIQSY